MISHKTCFWIRSSDILKVSSNDTVYISCDRFDCNYFLSCLANIIIVLAKLFSFTLKTKKGRSFIIGYRRQKKAYKKCIDNISALKSVQQNPIYFANKDQRIDPTQHMSFLDLSKVNIQTIHIDPKKRDLYLTLSKYHLLAKYDYILREPNKNIRIIQFRINREGMFTIRQCNTLIDIMQKYWKKANSYSIQQTICTILSILMVIGVIVSILMFKSITWLPLVPIAILVGTFIYSFINSCIENHNNHLAKNDEKALQHTLRIK